MSYVSDCQTIEFFSRSKIVSDVASHVVSRDNIGEVHCSPYLEDQFHSAAFNNYEIINKVILRNMLQRANHEKTYDPCFKAMLTNLANGMNSLFRGLNLYLTAMGSW